MENVVRYVVVKLSMYNIPNSRTMELLVVVKPVIYDARMKDVPIQWAFLYLTFQ